MSTKQLEIDGEFFENPAERCKSDRVAKIIAAVFEATSARVKLGMILSSPVFPNRLHCGGVVVQPPCDKNNEDLVVWPSGENEHILIRSKKDKWLPNTYQ
jgi:hypothetical protein